MKLSAKFSEDGVYRYALYRVWDEAKPQVMFICLNPSTADENEDDKTSKKCIDYAQQWHDEKYGGLVMCNLFAFCATKPEEMRKASKPVGDENDDYVRKHASEASLVIAAWGNHGTHKNRAAEVRELLRKNKVQLYYLEKTKKEQPSHPLYLDGSLQPTLWKDA